MNSQEFVAAQTAGLLNVDQHVLMHCAYGATIQGSIVRFIHGAPSPVGVVLSVSVATEEEVDVDGRQITPASVEEHNMLVPVSQIVAVEWAVDAA